jgi:hypothetical protein
MEIETESEQTYEPILNVGDENIKESERSEQFMIEGTKALFIHRVRIIVFFPFIYLFIYLNQFIGPCPSGRVRTGLKVPCEALPRYKL